MKTLIEIVHITELKKGDRFSFRTTARPIFWKFIKIEDNEIFYKSLRSGDIRKIALRNFYVLKDLKSHRRNE